MYITEKDCPFDVNEQSLEIANSDGIRQSKLMPERVALEYIFEDVKTLVEAFQRGCRVSNNGPCLGWRDSDSEYKWLSYWEAIQRSKDISCGLVHIGMNPGQETNVGIYAQNCVEWVLVEQACYLQSAVVVAIYDTLGSDACTFMLNHADVEFLICDKETKVNNILDMKEAVPKLRHIISIQNLSQEVMDLAAEKEVNLHLLTEIEELGRQNNKSLIVASSSDLAAICFTSGSTGDPKGVMLTHANFLAPVSGFQLNMGVNSVNVGDIMLSYLPMAHVFERCCQLQTYMGGGAVGFFRGDLTQLADDIRVLCPNLMPVVPRVLNKIYDKINIEVNSSALKKCLLKLALYSKKAELKRGIVTTNSIWDRLILKNIRMIFGGKIKLILSGGAPLRSEVLSFFRCTLGCAIVEAYGQTETTGGGTCTVAGDCSTGSVGPPFPCCFVRLIDVPDMGYFKENGEGEILMKGPNVMKGYFKDPVRTAEVLDDEGWLRTGDIGKWTKYGTLRIIDRKKNILKLSQGEYISPEKVEGVYQASPFVEQVFVHGDSLQSFLVGIIVPIKEMLMTWCLQNGIKGEWKEICENNDVKAHILNELHDLGKKSDLKGFEQVKEIYIHDDVFSIENGILTATMKIKRDVCKRQFRNIIENMYRNS